MPPLLVLSPDRVAAEVRRAVERAADDLEWRRRARKLGLDCVCLYLDGLLLALASFRFTGPHAEIALCSGLFMGNAGPLVLAYVFWVRETLRRSPCSSTWLPNKKAVSPPMPNRHL